LPSGSIVGTSSLRRKSQIVNLRNDLKIKDLRGNVDTRLKKLDNGKFDAIILAAAGLKRMGFENRITQYLDISFMIPAIGQGALGIEIRENDNEILEIVSFLKDELTFFEVEAERAFLKTLEGGCQVPIGCYGKIKGDILNLKGFVASVDGSKFIKSEINGEIANYKKLGVKLAENILNLGGKEILEDVYNCSNENNIEQKGE
jgi:hydroxymethylbilane synthase